MNITPEIPNERDGYNNLINIKTEVEMKA